MIKYLSIIEKYSNNKCSYSRVIARRNCTDSGVLILRFRRYGFNISHSCLNCCTDIRVYAKNSSWSVLCISLNKLLYIPWAFRWLLIGRTHQRLIFFFFCSSSIAPKHIINRYCSNINKNSKSSSQSILLQCTCLRRKFFACEK